MIAIDKHGNGKEVGVAPAGYKASKIVINRDDVTHMKRVLMLSSKEDAIRWFTQLEERFE